MKTNRRLLSAAAGLAMLAVCPSVWSQQGPVAAEPVRLFSAAVAPVNANVPQKATVLSTQPVMVDATLLAAVEAQDELDFDLVLGNGQTGKVESVVRRGANSYTVKGSLPGDSLGFFTLVVEEDAVAGIIEAPTTQQIMRLNYLADGVHQIRHIDASQFGRCRPPAPKGGAGQVVERPKSSGVNPDDLVPNDDSGGTIAGVCNAPQVVFDVLIVYTTMARQAMGSVNAANAECQLAIETANQAYINSQIDVRMRIVWRGEIGYNESGDFDDHLSRITDASDGALDSINVNRNTYRADFVSLWVADDDGGTICGLAHCNSDQSDSYSVCNWDCAVSNFSFHHEIGHNQGCDHNYDDAGAGCGNDSYSYGWRFNGNNGQWRTVMAYDNEAKDFTRINWFSNPNVYYDGARTGRPAGDDDEAYNAATIRNTRFSCEGFRSSGLDVWVDFGHVGVEIGSFALPFNTVAEGHNATLQSVGGSELTILHVKAGQTSQKPTLNKRLTLIPCGGTVRIGG